ncbi:MAG: sigma-70 family RNA polymerase sigma factor [Cytophagaceae bacterium]|nr:sigma-70 family RNA polymerase sigma factor [Cytophagaceae bacterium]
MKYTDKDIIKAIRTGEDHKALEALYKEVFPKVKKIITDTDKGEEAKDIFQEALLIFYKQVIGNKFDEKYEVAGFIYTIARNLWINRVNKKKRTVNMNEEEVPVSVETSVLDKMLMEDRKEVIRKVFSKLGDKCRDLLTYTIFQDMSMEDVALRMEFNSANAATTAVFRCKQKLMAIVKDSNIEDLLRG